MVSFHVFLWYAIGQILRYLSERGVPMTLTGASYFGVSVNMCVHDALSSTDQLLLSNSV